MAVVASCVIGTDPCDDSHVVYVGFPWWTVIVVTVGALALIAGFVALLVRADRRRPWD